MKLFKRKFGNQRGQGLMEYTLIVFLVTLGFWGAMKGTDIGPELVSTWSKVVDCVTAPFACVS